MDLDDGARRGDPDANHVPYSQNRHLEALQTGSVCLHACACLVFLWTQRDGKLKTHLPKRSGGFTVAGEPRQSNWRTNKTVK